MPVWMTAPYWTVILQWRTNIAAACCATILVCGTVVVVLGLQLMLRQRLSERQVMRCKVRIALLMSVMVGAAIVAFALLETGPKRVHIAPAIIADVLFICAAGTCAVAAKCVLGLIREDEPQHARSGPHALAAIGGMDFLGATGFAVVTGVLFAVAMWVQQHW